MKSARIDVYKRQAGDSAKSDEDNKETSVKEKEDGDSSGKDSDDESEEDAEVRCV